MANLVCKNCGYRFSSELDYKKKMCPYCGESSVKGEESADELLFSVDE